MEKFDRTNDGERNDLPSSHLFHRHRSSRFRHIFGKLESRFGMVFLLIRRPIRRCRVFPKCKRFCRLNHRTKSGNVERRYTSTRVLTQRSAFESFSDFSSASRHFSLVLWNSIKTSSHARCWIYHSSLSGKIAWAFSYNRQKYVAIKSGSTVGNTLNADATIRLGKIHFKMEESFERLERAKNNRS